METLDNLELPELPEFCYMWASGALASDNFIYYMPRTARRIMRLNPDNDSLSSVGDDLEGGEFKYLGTVVGNDDCVYGIPYNAKRIIKFDPTNPDTTCTVGEESEEQFKYHNGVLASDGYIYAVKESGKVLLQIDSTRSRYTTTWIGDRINVGNGRAGWGDPIVGIDKCIYWPPSYANRVLKFDPETQQLPLLVGGILREERWRTWQVGARGIDGVIYCIPSYPNKVLVIDPFKEISMTLQNNFRQYYPQELGRLFAKDEE